MTPQRSRKDALSSRRALVSPPDRKVLYNAMQRQRDLRPLPCNVPEQAALIATYLDECASRIKDTIQADLEVLARSAEIALESEEDFWDALSHMSEQTAMLILDPAHKC